MKILSHSLSQFISDFKLEKKDQIICFEATCYFSTASNVIQIQTEVQIVTINPLEMDVLYLLSPDVYKYLIPEMYALGKENYSYRKDVALIIKGHSVMHGAYVLSIHPTGQECDMDTLSEIHGRTFN